MKAIEKLKKELLKNQEIVDFCEQNKLTQEQINHGISELYLHKDNSEICAKCLGKLPCKSSAYQMMTILKYENDRIKIVYKDCPYVLKKETYPIKFIHCQNRENEEFKFDKPSQAIPLKAIYDFSEQYGKGKKLKGMYLFGGFGVGKSFLFMHLAKLLEEKGARIIFAGYPDLMRQIKSEIYGGAEEIIAELKTVDILIFDDIGSENNTPYIRDDVLSPVLQYRMDNDLPVFMTSNLNFNELSKHFSETNNELDDMKGRRIIERIKYLMKPFEIKGENYRSDEWK